AEIPCRCGNLDRHALREAGRPALSAGRPCSPRTLYRRSSSPAAEEQAEDEKHHEDEEQDFRDTGRPPADPQKAEESRDDRDDEEDQSPIKHFPTPRAFASLNEISVRAVPRRMRAMARAWPLLRLFGGCFFAAAARQSSGRGKLWNHGSTSCST